MLKNIPNDFKLWQNKQYETVKVHDNYYILILFYTYSLRYLVKYRYYNYLIT